MKLLIMLIIVVKLKEISMKVEESYLIVYALLTYIYDSCSRNVSYFRPVDS